MDVLRGFTKCLSVLRKITLLNCLEWSTPLLLVLLFSPLLQAASIRGYVVKNEQGTFIQNVGDPRLYELKPATQESVRNLGRLSHNDFLQGQGEYRGDLFLLQSIDFVGLSELLGPWQAVKDQTLITFETYNQVSIFTPRSLHFNRINLFDYSVAPDSGNVWKIFVTGSRNVSIANLKIEENKLTLKFINLETGNFEPPFELVRKSP